jgi:hypothetical protein
VDPDNFSGDLTRVRIPGDVIADVEFVRHGLSFTKVYFTSVTFRQCMFARGSGPRDDASDAHGHWIACGKRFAQAFVERFALVLQALLNSLVCMTGRSDRFCADVGHIYSWLAVRLATE